MAIHRHDNHKSANALMEWVDKRFPATKVWNEHLAEYMAAKNFNFWYFFGSLAILMLVVQIATGIFLTMLISLMRNLRLPQSSTSCEMCLLAGL